MMGDSIIVVVECHLMCQCSIDSLVQVQRELLDYSVVVGPSTHLNAQKAFETLVARKLYITKPHCRETTK
jgi:hypothetical protein